jgi:hypothetical protein
MVEYNYDPQKNIVTVYPNEALSVLDISEYAQKILADSNIKTGFIDLVDFQEVFDFQFTYKEATTFPAIFTDLINKKDHKGTIILTKSNLQFGIARMWSTIMDEYLDVHVARSVEEAEKSIELIHGL